MLNTRASINTAFRDAVTALGLPLTVLYDDYQDMPAGSGPYPALVVRVLRSTLEPAAHLGGQTPRTPAGAERHTLTLEVEIRTKSATWNEALRYATLIRREFDVRTKPRRTWLSGSGAPNPAPADAGVMRFGESRLDLLQDPAQTSYKSAFLTWTVEVEIPI